MLRKFVRGYARAGARYTSHIGSATRRGAAKNVQEITNEERFEHAQPTRANGAPDTTSTAETRMRMHHSARATTEPVRASRLVVSQVPPFSSLGTRSQAHAAVALHFLFVAQQVMSRGKTRAAQRPHLLQEQACQ